MPSRAAAVRELLKRGLAAEGFVEATFGSKSEDYGVVGETPPGRDGDSSSNGPPARALSPPQPVGNGFRLATIFVLVCSYPSPATVPSRRRRWLRDRSRSRLHSKESANASPRSSPIKHL